MAKTWSEDAEHDGQGIKEGRQMLENVWSVSKTLSSCQSKLAPPSLKHSKRKQKHNEEARGENVPQSRACHRAHDR